MGEAKRRAAADSPGRRDPSSRSWAPGSITVVANDVICFVWTGTRQEAIALQRAYLDVVNALDISASSYARRAAGYLMVYGMPQEGDTDQRPSRHGEHWDAGEIRLCQHAVLWLVLREHVPDAGQRIEDVFAGKFMVALFEGDRDRVLEYTAREFSGEDPDSLRHEFKMVVGFDHDQQPPRLDPRAAKPMTGAELYALAGHLPPAKADELYYVPRVPIDCAEAKAMLAMATIFVDATDLAAVTDPAAGFRIYAGYTEEELRRGKPAVRVG